MQGTSSSEGAALSGALLEHFAQLGCTGIFASHLFELFELPLQPQLMQRVQLKTVRESEREGGRERERESRGQLTDKHRLAPLEDAGLTGALALY